MKKKNRLICLGLISFLLASCTFVPSSSSSSALEYVRLQGAEAYKIDNGYRFQVVAPAILSNVGTLHACDKDGKKLNGDGLVIDPFHTQVYMAYYVNSSMSYSDSKDIDKLRDKTFEKEFQEEMDYDHVYFDRHYYYLDDKTGKVINNLKTLNESYGKEGFIYNSKFYNALKKGLAFSLASKEKFSLGVGGLSTLWDYYIQVAQDNISQSPSGDQEKARYQELSYQNKKVIFEDPDPAYLDYMRNLTPTNDELGKALVFNDKTHEITFNAIPRIDAYVKEHEKIGRTLGKMFVAAGSSIAAQDEVNSFLHPSLTLGGYGKGEATELFRSSHQEHAYFISGGTSSIVAYGNKPDGNRWEFTIGNPLYFEEQMAGVYADSSYSQADYAFGINGDLTLSTSGYYQNYFYVEDQDNSGKYIRRDHIVDSDRNSPSFGYSISYFGATSAITEDAGYGDMYTTTMMNCRDFNELKEVLESLRSVTGTIPQYFCQVVNEDGKSLSLYVPKKSEGSFFTCHDAYPDDERFRKPGVTSLKTIPE